MKVLLVNGSPHEKGCTYTALCQVSEALNRNGIDTDLFWIGKKPISGCIACKTCETPWAGGTCAGMKLSAGLGRRSVRYIIK